MRGKGIFSQNEHGFSQTGRKSVDWNNKLIILREKYKFLENGQLFVQFSLPFVMTQ